MRSCKQLVRVAEALVSPLIVLIEAAPDYTVCVEFRGLPWFPAAAEPECEQYLRGFIGAYLKTTNNQEACSPDQDLDDEVRCAFMKWAK